MNITRQNYMALANSGAIPFSKMPKALSDTHAEMPDYLEFYNDDADIKAVVDLYLQKVNDFIKKLNTPMPQEQQGNQDQNEVEVIDVEPITKSAGFFSTGWGKLLIIGIAVGAIFGTSNFIDNGEQKKNK